METWESAKCHICNDFQLYRPEPSNMYFPSSSELWSKNSAHCSTRAGWPGFCIYTTVADVYIQSRKGCKSCTVLYHAALQYPNSNHARWTAGSLSPDMLPSSEGPVRLMADCVYDGAIQCKVYDPPLVGGGRAIPIFTFQLFAVVGKPNPWNRLLEAPSCPTFVLTDERRACFLSWITDCVENHPDCQRSPFMPKRLIDMGQRGDSGDLRLREDVAEMTTYIAVSHSWRFSEAHKSMTRKENLMSRKQRLPREVLSRTFCDIIDICRWLGIRYVWIDTICIIQDDHDDWAYHASQMGNIYEGAYITIAVHYDPNGSPNDGCFLQRKGIHEVPLPQDMKNTISTYIKVSHQHDLKSPGSLMSRAWCVQERLLSPRILHFRPWEVVFECFTHRRCECESLNLEIHDLYNHRVMEKNLAKVFSLGQQNPQHAELNDEQCWARWKDIIALYTPANLSFPTDRLAALSSLAQRMPRHIFGEYLAGLWTGRLLDQLLWTHKHHEKPFRYKEEYVAPSFSWASVYGATVGWYNHQSRGNRGRKALILESGSIPINDKDPTGPVSYGFIHMRLRMFEATITSTMQDTTQINLEYSCESAQSFRCSATLDTEDDKHLIHQKVFIGEIFGEKGHAYFLVMRELETKPGLFERVGIGSFSLLGEASHGDCFSVPKKPINHDCFHEAQEREITLI